MPQLSRYTNKKDEQPNVGCSSFLLNPLTEVRGIYAQNVCKSIN